MFEPAVQHRRFAPRPSVANKISPRSRIPPREKIAAARAAGAASVRNGSYLWERGGVDDRLTLLCTASGPSELYIVPAASVSVVFKVRGHGNLPSRLSAAAASLFLSDVGAVCSAAAAQECDIYSPVLINSHRSAAATSISAAVLLGRRSDRATPA